MKKNKQVKKDMRLEYNKGLLILTIIFSLAIIAFIIYKYIILQVMSLSANNFNYGVNNVVTLVISYVVGLIFILALYNATRVLSRKEPRIYVDTEGLLINSLLGPEYHKWAELKSFRVAKKGRGYTLFIEAKNRKATIGRKNFAKKCIYFISFLLGGFGVECTFSLSPSEYNTLFPTIKYNVTEDKRGFKTLFKSRK